jgi:hypothetical protein
MHGMGSGNECEIFCSNLIQVVGDSVLRIWEHDEDDFGRGVPADAYPYPPPHLLSLVEMFRLHEPDHRALLCIVYYFFLDCARLYPTDSKEER